MNKYFNIYFQFDPSEFKREISNVISSKAAGYSCVIDANVLTIAQSNHEYRRVLNNARINTCDGSSIAFFAGLIHGEKLKAYNGPEIFQYYIEKPQYRQILLGNTSETVTLIKEKLTQNNLITNHIFHVDVPFASLDEFNYPEIANQVNKISPDIIWVSLGAPKQELFMARLLPYLNQGVMFGIGAAFNFYIGKLKLPKFNLFGIRIIWLDRLISEPRKLSKRILNYIILLPRILVSELWIKLSHQKQK